MIRDLSLHYSVDLVARYQEGTSVVQPVARWITVHYHLSSNLGVGISEGCFSFDIASLLLALVRPI